MGVVGDLGKYAQFQAAESIPAAAANPGGTMGAAVGLGMGAAIGQQMAGVFQQQPQQPAAAPPPLPGGKSFFVAVNGQQQGPFDLGALSQRQQQGQLTRETLVWAQGMASWTPAGQVPDLAALFANAPPPLPPR
jgi:hypothetical protein